jgi:hypothetical protein
VVCIPARRVPSFGPLAIKPWTARASRRSVEPDPVVCQDPKAHLFDQQRAVWGDHEQAGVQADLAVRQAVHHPGRVL